MASAHLSVSYEIGLKFSEVSLSASSILYWRVELRDGRMKPWTRSWKRKRRWPTLKPFQHISTLKKYKELSFIYIYIYSYIKDFTLCSCVVVLPRWMLAALFVTIITLFSAFLFCVREIFVLHSRVGDQQSKITSLESVTEEIQRRIAQSNISTDDISKVEVWSLTLSLYSI